MLGVGISRERKNLSTAAELLSKEAYDGGLRQNTETWRDFLAQDNRLVLGQQVTLVRMETYMGNYMKMLIEIL